jgi:hypothetical protein
VIEIPDERLIDHALGLEDDPELEQELARSEELRARLQLLEAELRQIDTELYGVLPPVDEGWADLSREQWRRLQPFLEMPAPRPRRSLGLRLLAPALALAIIAALLAGLFSLRSGGSQSSSTFGSRQAAPETASIPSALQKTVSGLAAGYRQVVVAQAGAVSAGRQPYDVVRVLKGPALSTFSIDLGRATGVPEGSLQVVYLEPLNEPAPAAGHAQPALGSSSASGTSGGSNGADTASPASATTESPQTVTYQGQPAIVQPLPPGIDPSTLAVPR